MSEGFSAEFLEQLGFVPPGHGDCGTAFKRLTRVIVHDADTDPLFIGLQEVVRLGRFKSSHSVPLLGRNGVVHGVLSLHFTRRHLPDDRECRLVDLYAQIAVDFIERWQAEAALRHSERQKQQLLSALPVGVYTCDAQGLITYYNAAAAAIWGREPVLGEERWCGSHRLYQNNGTPVPLETCLMADAVLRGRSARGEEVIIESPNGTRRHVMPSPLPLRDSTGKIVGALNVMVDVTDRHEAQIARRESDARLQQLLALLPVGVFTIGGDRKFTFCNRRAVELWGFEPPVGEPLETFHHRFRIFWPDGSQMGDADNPLALALSGAAPRKDFEIVLERPDGRRLTLEINIDIVHGADGDVSTVICVFHDITERKQADAALRRSEERFRTLASHAPVGIFLTDAEGGTQFVNDNWMRMTGLTQEQARGTGWMNVLHPDDRERVVQCWEDAVVRRAESHLEFRVLRADGAITWLDGRAVPLRDGEGAISGYIGTVADITQRRRAEQARRDSQELLQGSVDALTSHIAVLDARGNICAVNASWRDFATRHDFGPGFAVGDNYLAACLQAGRGSTPPSRQQGLIDRPDRAHRAAEGIRAVIAGELPLFTLEYDVKVNGSPRWFVMRVTRFGVGDAMRLVVAHEEVTPRKLAEDALRESEEFHRVIAELTSDFAWSATVDAGQIEAESITEGFTRILGYTLEQLKTEGWRQVIAAEDAPQLAREMERLLSGETCEGEIRVLTRTGRRRWLRYYVHPLRSSDDVITRLIGSCVDITDRRDAEVALRKSEERLRVASETGRLGIWDWNLRDDTVEWTDVLYSLHGMDPRDGRITTEMSRQMIHPEDRERVAQAISAALVDGERYEFECRCIRPDGSVIWLYNYALVMREDGQPVRVLGGALDVTARRRAEEAIRESEAQLRMIADTVPVMLMRCDRDGRFVFANRAYLERRGLTLEKLVGRTVSEILGAEAFSQIEAYFQRVLTGETVRFETELFYSGVGSRHVSVAYVPERDRSGEITGFVGAITDVTELRRADASSRRLAAIVASSSDAIIGVDLGGVITSWNRGAQRLFGYDESEVLGQTVSLLIPPERHDEGPGILRRVRAGEHIEHYQTTRRRKDGRVAHISLTISPIKDSDGRIIGASKIARDVTELHLAQEALRERTRTLEAVNRVSAQLVAELDLDRIVQGVTEVGREVSGGEFGAFFFSRTGGAGDDCELLAVAGVPRAQLENWVSLCATPLFRATFRGEGVVRVGDVHADARHGRFEVDAVDGVERPVLRSFMAVPVVARAGEVIGALIFGHRKPEVFSVETELILAAIAAQAAMAIDNAKLYHALDRELREKRRAEADLLAAQKELQAHAASLEQRVLERTQSLREAITQMEEFSYTVSHDLRAPLRAMNSYSQALIEDYGPQLDETARHYLERIQRSSQRMEKLTHDVLNYSRLARTEITLAAVDLDALLRDMIYQYAEFQPPQAEIKIKRPLLDVCAHEVSLGQCIANLLANAVKFVAPGVTPRIKIHTEQRGEFVRLWIVDNGIGIEPQFQSRLFQVFERLHGRQQYEGTGIGLAIVRKAIDKMGGRCGVESDGSNGSRFWIELPPASPSP